MDANTFDAGFELDSPIHEQKPLDAKELPICCDRLLSLPEPTPVMVIHPLTEVYEQSSFPISWFRNEKVPTDSLPYPDDLLNDDWIADNDFADHFAVGSTEVFVPHSSNWTLNPLTPPNPGELTPPSKNHQTTGSNDTILPYPGGKGRYADWITNQFPQDNRTYIEPFCGSAAVFLHASPTEDEILNDANTDLYTFLKVAKQSPRKLINFVEQIPYARVEYETLISDWVDGNRPNSDVKRAGVFWAIQQMSQHAKLNQHAGFKTQPKYSCGRTFYGARNHLKETIDRFEDVTIECKDWTDIITIYDTPESFFYCDPPYADKTDEYTDSVHHDQLFATLKTIKGRFAVSCENLHDRVINSNLLVLENNKRRRRGGQKKATTEQLVLNYDPETGQKLTVKPEFTDPETAIKQTRSTSDQTTLNDIT